MGVRTVVKGLPAASSIFLAGVLAGFLASLLVGGPGEAATVAVQTPPIQVTRARVEAVSEAVAEAGGGVVASSPIPAAAAFFLNNLSASLAAAYTPLLPWLWATRVIPWAVRGVDVERLWGILRYTAYTVPSAALFLNGLLLYLVVGAAGLRGFMPLEASAILVMGGLGIGACLNSRSPEAFRESYRGSPGVTVHASLTLLASSIMEVMDLGA